MATQLYSRTRGLSDDAVHAEALLNRYPDISEKELANLIRTFAHLPLLDFARMAVDERLGDKLNVLYRDHGDKLNPPVLGGMWALAVPVVIALGLLYYVIA